MIVNNNFIQFEINFEHELAIILFMFLKANDAIY